MFEKSLSDLSTGRSLQDNKVVSLLAGHFINDVVTAKDVNGVFVAINRYSEVFLGMDDRFTADPEWNCLRGLGRALAKQLSVSADQASIDVFRSAFGVFARKALTIVKQSPGQSDEELQKKTVALREYMTACLMGYADTIYPEGLK